MSSYPERSSFKRDYDDGPGYGRRDDRGGRGGYGGGGRRRDDRRGFGGGRGGYGGRGRDDDRGGNPGDLHRRHENLYPALTEEELFGQKVGTEALQTGERDYSIYDDVKVSVDFARAIKDIPPIDTFEDLSREPYDLDSEVYQNTVRAKYFQPTPIQKHALPTGMVGYDLLACSQTGSGKTCAFIIPILHRIATEKLKLYTMSPGHHEDREFRYNAKGGRAYPFCIIMSPTRELVQQTAKASWMLSYGTSILTRVAYGGDPSGPQRDALQMGCDILVATPGRLLDFIKQGVVETTYIRFVVFDECDRMLDMGFEPQIRDILRELPPIHHSVQDPTNPDITHQIERQTLLFSATFPKEIKNLAMEFLRQDRLVSITVGQIGSSNPNLSQRVVLVERSNDKLRLLTEYLTGQNADLNKMLVDVYGAEKETDHSLSTVSSTAGISEEYNEAMNATYPDSHAARNESLNKEGIIPYQTIVFTNFKSEADRIFRYFDDMRYRVAVIHGDMTQRERENNLKYFKAGRTNILIGTDVAQRGLDIPNVRLVLNYDVPGNVDDYTHRIGRTGRAGRPGLAVTFICPDRDNLSALKDIRRKMMDTKQPIPDWFNRAIDNMVSDKRSARNARRGGFGGGSRGGFGGGGGRGGDRGYGGGRGGYGGDRGRY